MIENLNNYLKSTTQQTLDDGSKEVCDYLDEHLPDWQKNYYEKICSEKKPIKSFGFQLLLVC